MGIGNERNRTAESTAHRAKAGVLLNLGTGECGAIKDPLFQ